ncbi:hypothetical protein PFISCL1PPCAC_22042, partial [Pristionchus fissidentatus]
GSYNHLKWITNISFFQIHSFFILSQVYPKFHSPFRFARDLGGASGTINRSRIFRLLDIPRPVTSTRSAPLGLIITSLHPLNSINFFLTTLRSLSITA